MVKWENIIEVVNVLKLLLWQHKPSSPLSYNLNLFIFVTYCLLFRQIIQIRQKMSWPLLQSKLQVTNSSLNWILSAHRQLCDHEKSALYSAEGKQSLENPQYWTNGVSTFKAFLLETRKTILRFLSLHRVN